VPEDGLTQPILDREQPLAAVEGALAEAESGRGRALLFEAQAGMGKTRLLAEAAALGRTRGLTVAQASGAETERALAWGVTLQLGERLISLPGGADPAGLLEGIPLAARALFGFARELDGEPAVGDELSLVHGVFTVFARLADERPLLLVVDDLHWADGSSLRLLLYLLQRSEELPAALVLAQRPADGADERLEAIAIHPRVRLETLAPLSPAAVGVLAQRELGAPAAAPMVNACVRATRGNPFYLHELLRELRAEQTSDERTLLARASEAVPETVARSVAVRVGRLGRDAIAFARALAILGDHAAFRHTARLARLELDRAVAAADALARAEIISPGEPMEFVHPLVRAVIERDVPAATRSALHLAAAHLLDDEQQGAERVASQLLAAVPTGDDWVVQTLHEAARAARSALAPESAVRYLQRALEEPPAGEQRAATLAELGRAEALSARPEAVEHLAEAETLTPPGPLRAQLALDRGRALYALGRHQAAAVAAEEGLAELGEVADGSPAIALHDALQALFVAISLLVPELQQEALGRAERILARAEGELTYGQRALSAQAAVHSALTGRPRTETLALAERAWDQGRLLEEETSAGAAWTFVTAALTQSGHYSRSVEVTDLAIADAQQRADPMAFATAMYIRGCPLIIQGQVRRAIADFQTALDARRYGWRQFPRAAAGYCASALLQAGDVAAAEALLAEEAGFHPVRDLEDLGLLGARAELHLLQGRFSQALADAEALLAAQGPLQWPGATWRNVGALAELGSGRPERARELAQSELALGERTGNNHIQVGALRALGLAAGGEEGIELLRRAVELAGQSEPHLAGLLAHIDLGAALRRANRRAGARPLLEQAADRALAWGALAAHERARTELAATGARPRRAVLLSGPASLTPSERRIADLAAGGMTNREIAQALFVTPKTVEYHLRNAYMKLGIERRAELQTALSA
jgi:DNA-binding CsgD family transcriptional regulator